MTEGNNNTGNIKLNQAFWNGVFICLTIALVWWGYNYIRGANHEDGFFIKVKFEDILGLSKSNDVIYAGLVIGEVKDVGKIGGPNSSEITPIVTLNIKEEYEDLLYKDLLFTIKSPLFVGDYWVEAKRGALRSKQKLLEGEVVLGAAELNPSKLPEEIQKDLKPILLNLQVFTEQLKLLVNDAKTIENARSSISSLSSSLLKAENILKNIESSGIGSAAELNKLRESFDNIYNTSVKLNLAIDDFQLMMGNLNEVAEKLNNGDGTLSKLLNDKTLYEEYTAIAKNANSLLKDMQDNPKKYIRWSDIIKGWRAKD